MARPFYTGIDIGTYHVKVVIAAPGESPDHPMKVLGTGSASSRGMRLGYIIDTKEAARSILEALARAEAAAKVKVRSARIAMGGVGLDETRSLGEISLTPSGGIVSDRDIEKVLKESENRAAPRLGNKSIIHTIPLEYRIDGTRILGKPNGLQGTKFAVDTLLITMLTKHHSDLVNAVEAAGVEVEGVMASPIAASMVTLTKAQRMAGVVLANIGAETLSIIVFDNDTPISIKVFPVGSADITNTIALSLKISLSEAEAAKRGGVTTNATQPKKMNTIVSSRLKDMFALINAHLKTIGRNRLLPAGIVITGGGSGLASASDVAKTVLQLPAQVSQLGQTARATIIDATWAVSYGLCRWGFGEDLPTGEYSLSSVAKNAFDSVRQTLRSLLP